MSLTPRPLPSVVLLVAATACGHAMASGAPLWELGAGISALSLPNYRGSDQSSLYALPFPYLVYRGEVLKADRQGIRGILFDSDRAELNISLAGSLPVNSEDNRARRGMPDLHPTVEVGPALDLNLWRTNDRRYALDLRLPVRTAITVGDAWQSIGWVFSPRLNLDVSDVGGLPGWNLGLHAGPVYGSKRNHGYFYSVAPQDATATRPAFDARRGYAGTEFLVSVSKRYPKYWLGAFARWDDLEGASFVDSPLVKRERYFAAGVGIAWIVGESSTRVEAAE